MRVTGVLLLIAAGLLVLTCLRDDWWNAKIRGTEATVGLSHIESDSKSFGNPDLNRAFRGATSRWQNLGSLTLVLSGITVLYFGLMGMLAVAGWKISLHERLLRNHALIVTLLSAAILLFSIAFVAHAPNQLVESGNLSWGWPRTWCAGILGVVAARRLYQEIGRTETVRQLETPAE